MNVIGLTKTSHVNGRGIRADKECYGEQKTDGDHIMICETCRYWDYGDCDKTGYYKDPDDSCGRWKGKNA